MKINQSSTIAIILLAVLSLVSFSACEEKEDEDQLTGKWISITKDYNYGDTIVFTSDGKVEKWFDDLYSTNNAIIYNVSNDTIYFTNAGNTTSSHKISINNSNLTINKFSYAFTILPMERQDVTFKKIE